MPFRDDGFFHALQQDPEDDLLRRVYADFLEDRGDDESTARAEFIRVQVELTALWPFSDRAAQLVARQNELLTRWQRAWLGPWADTLHGWTFRRGMVEAVHADASVFLDNAADWFAEWPTLTVAKLTRTGDHLPELASSPWLAHLRGLDLSNNGIDSSALIHLTSSRFIGLLQALDLSDNPIGPMGAGLLATTRSANDWSELHLARCGLWHEGLLSLLAGSARWRRLDLSGNGLTRLGLVRLVDSPLMRNLESLDLAGNPLGDNGASALADSPNSAGLVDLGLCDTGSGDAGVTALANSRNLPNLRSLDLRGNHCGWQRDRAGRYTGGIDELAQSPLLSQLRRMLLAPNGPGNGWTSEILSAVRPSRPVEVVRNWWAATILRSSRYLVPSQLVECDLEELWWLGDTRNRERLPCDSYRIVDSLGQFPELLHDMDSRLATVLRMRYGLEEEPKTLEEIGKSLGLNREDVRQLEKDALGKLEVLMKGIPSELWY
jgi:uncharacterized protein (TIGR02996 family)